MSDVEFMLYRMEEELDDACAYVDRAIKCKNEDKGLSDLLAKLSEQELEHYTMLKTYFAKMIDKMKMDQPDKAHKVTIIYEWEYEKYVEKEHKVKMKHTSLMIK